MTRILYVDDETLFRDTSKQFLEMAGYTIDDVSSGREALNNLYHTSYDAIISDYQMSGMTGIELLKTVRSEIGDIPFILFTGKGREEVVIEAIENGVDYYVQKGGKSEPLFADLIHKITLAINRRESDVEFKKNAERLRKAQKIGKIGCWEYDIRSNQIWGSEEAFRLFGLNTPAGEVSLDVIEACIPDKDRIHQALIDLIHYNKKHCLEYTIHPADGTAPKILLSVAHLEKTPAGKEERVVGIIQDVTEQKNFEIELSQKNADLSAALEEITATEEELKQQLEELRSAHQEISESEQKYRTLFEENGLGIALHEIIFDESKVAYDYRFIDLNPAFERLTGLSAHDVISRTVLEVLPNTEPYWIETYGRVARSGVTINFEQFSKELNKYFDVTAYSPSTGQFVTIIQDVTKRKENETRLIELNAYLENLITIANVPIIVWDSELLITRINRSFELLIGLSSGDVTGRPLSILFPHDRIDQCMRLIRTTHTGVRWETVEIPIVHWDGSVRIVVWNSATIYSSDGKTPVATIAQGRDITDEKVHDQEKAKAMGQIQENIAQLAILNDSIRNPLTVIAMYVDMVGDQKITHGVLDEVKKVDDMVSNLDREWIKSTKILDHLRKQGHLSADFTLATSSCVDNSKCLQITKSNPVSHQRPTSGQFIEEVQAQLYSILDSIDALVYVADIVTHTILYINEKGRALYGNVIGQQCYVILHEQSDPCPFCTNHLLVHESEPTGVYRWEFHNARIGKWFDCRDRAIRWTDGRLVRLEIATNITGRKLAEEALFKKAEELHAAYEEISATEEELRQSFDDLQKSELALHESEEKYRTVFENTGTATVVLEENGIISLANKEFMLLSGFSLEEIIGKKKWVEFVIPEDLQRMQFQNQLRLQDESKALSHYEFQFVTRTGDIRNIYLTIGVISGTKKSIASLLDITERKNSEETLKKSEERYREYFTISRDCMFITSPDGQWIDFNDATLKIFGYESRESFFSINVSSLYADPKERPKILSLINKEEYIKDYPLLLKRKDGTLIDTLISTAPVRNPDGSIKSFIGSIQDISERNKAEEALQQSNKRMKLLTGLTRHDIMNLLTEIYLTRDLALESGDPNKAHIYMSSCCDTGKRIESIIEFTREFESCERINLEWRSTFSVIESAKSEVKPGRVIIENQVSPSLEIYTDPIIRKVFSTLLENSIRHGKTLSTIWLSATNLNGNLILTCEDDGIGIPIEEKERIFSHGYGKNTGLGLFLSREILSINGFLIRECGLEGKGARFEIIVPERKWRNTPVNMND